VVLAGGLWRDVAMLAEKPVDSTCLPRLIVGARFGQHVMRANIFRIVVGDAPVAGDIADRANRHPADLAGAFRNRTDHCEV
jgi:hypothetical protein